MNHLFGKRLLGSAICCALVAGLTAGCTKAARQKRHLENADRDFKAERYERAEIEYQRAVRIPPSPPEALAKLGLIYSLQGNSRAFAYLNTASQIGTTNIEARLKLAQMFASSFGTLTNAQKEARTVLDLAPTNQEALLLLVSSVVNTNQLREVTEVLRRLPDAARKSACYHTALGHLSLRQHLLVRAEAATELDAAEREFQQAIDMDSKYTSAYVGLASCFLARTNFSQAEATLRKAVAADPKSSAAHEKLAELYLSGTNYEAEAEAALKTAAVLTPPRSAVRLRYAQYLREHRGESPAQAYVEEISKQAPDYLPAWQFLAEVALEGGDTNACAANLKKVLAKDPNGYKGLLLEGKLMFAQGQVTNAINHFERMAGVFGNAADVQYLLARCYLLNRELPKALDALSLAVRSNPQHVDAILLQAELNLRRQNAAAAIGPLYELLSKPTPWDMRKLETAMFLLTWAYAQTDLDQALAQYRRMTQVFPRNVSVHILMGQALKRGRRAEARQAFESALKIQTNAILPLIELVNFDLQEQLFTNAYARVSQQLQYEGVTSITSTTNPVACYLLGATHYSEAVSNSTQATNNVQPSPRLNVSRPEIQGHVDEAVGAFLRALELAPLYQSAYVDLAKLYVESGRQEQALQQLKLRTNDVSALVRIGDIYGASANYTNAKQAYEQCISSYEQAVKNNTVWQLSMRDSDSYAIALNNLAYLCSERLNQLEEAYQLAEKLRKLNLKRPVFGDTVGWILYRRGDYAGAVKTLGQVESQYALLGEAPDPEVTFHLGMAYYMTGEEQAARATLKKFIDNSALAQRPENAERKSEAGRRLAVLEIDPAKADAAALTLLKAALKETPGDLVALLRIGAIQERDRDFEKARQSYQKGLEGNPENSVLLHRMTRLYYYHLKDTENAYEMARKAHRALLEDAEIAKILGILEYKRNDLTRSAGLLRQVAHELEKDAEVQFYLGMSLSKLNRRAEAQQALESALSLGLDDRLAKAAKAELTRLK